MLIWKNYIGIDYIDIDYIDKDFKQVFKKIILDISLPDHINLLFTNE